MSPHPSGRKILPLFVKPRQLGIPTTKTHNPTETFPRNHPRRPVVIKCAPHARHPRKKTTTSIRLTPLQLGILTTTAHNSNRNFPPKPCPTSNCSEVRSACPLPAPCVRVTPYSSVYQQPDTHNPTRSFPPKPFPTSNCF